VVREAGEIIAVTTPASDTASAGATTAAAAQAPEASAIVAILPVIVVTWLFA